MTADKELLALLKLRQRYWVQRLRELPAQDQKILAAGVLGEVSSILHAATGNDGLHFPTQTRFDDSLLNSAREAAKE